MTFKTETIEFIKEYAEANNKLSNKQISENINLSTTIVDYALKTKEMYLVESLCYENRFFLFTGILEKVVNVDWKLEVLNPESFDAHEKIFLKKNGLKFN